MGCCSSSDEDPVHPKEKEQLAAPLLLNPVLDEVQAAQTESVPDRLAESQHALRSIDEIAPPTAADEGTPAEQEEQKAQQVSEQQDEQDEQDEPDEQDGQKAPSSGRVLRKYASAQSAALRKEDARALVGERLHVYDTEEGRSGTVVDIRATFGDSTKHIIVFEQGGNGAPEEVLLQKAKGASKGFRFHVLEPVSEVDQRAAAKAEAAAQAKAAAQAQAHTAAESSVPRGVLLGMGNPLLDISANVELELVERYGVQMGNAILAEPSHVPLYEELVADKDGAFNVEYIAGGATQNSIRVAQWMLQDVAPGATAYIGCVGKDANGARLAAAAKADGVATHYLEDEQAPTGTCAVLINDAERSLVANLAAANEFKVEHLQAPAQRAVMEAARFYYVAGFFLTLPGGPPSVQIVAQHKEKSPGKVLAMNLAAPFIVDFFAEPLEAALPHVDILFGNESEAAAFGKKQGWESEDIADIALRASAMSKVGGTPRTVVFTQGANATIVASEGKVDRFTVPALAKEQLVDTNGAGDAFVGGFLSQLVQGAQIDACVAAGHFASRVIIQRSGCTFEGKPEFE